MPDGQRHRGSPSRRPGLFEVHGHVGFYVRGIRIGQVVKLLIRRVRSPGCRTSQAMLPEFVVHGHLDGIEVIGARVQVMASARLHGVRRP